MKNYISTLSVAGAALGLALLVSAPVLKADSDDTTTRSTTTSTTTVAPSQGTISEFAPDSFAIRTTTSATPVRYSYTKTTTYVDENGNPVSMETVRSGAPVTVFYSRNGDQMVASKVVVRQATVAPTTTQSTTTTTTRKSDD